MENLLIIGAGGHGKVVAEAAKLEGKFNEIAFLDDGNLENVLGYPVIGCIDDHKILKDKYRYAFVAIGNNKVRLNIIKSIVNEGYIVPKIIHPKAVISEYSVIDIGTVVLAGVVINVDTKIGKGCILNINSTIDHDSIIGDGCHISSGAVIRSMVKVKRLSTVKANACVTQGKTIEEEITINAGETI